MNPKPHPHDFLRKLSSSCIILALFAIGSPFMNAAAESTNTSSAPAPATPVPPPDPVNLSAIRYPVEEAHLTEPFWKSETVYGEAVSFLKENETDPIYGTLLFKPNKILRVRSSDGSQDYLEGRDFTIDAEHRRLILTSTTGIPSLPRAELYKQKGDPHSIACKADNPSVHLLYNEGWFRTIQIEVDYVRDEPWTGYTPQSAEKLLPKTFAKLRKGEGLNITITGDSISTGANASNRNAPFMPGFGPLTALELETLYHGRIQVINLARGGTWANGGVDKLQQTIDSKPDLLIIAFGMNDSNGRNPSKYAGYTKQIIDGVRAALPDTEFILVSSCLANPEWNWSPHDQFIPYRDALKPLCGPGVALADMTQLWTDLLQNKRYLDFAGNGINHPNDMGHRLYAQVLTSLLTAP